MKRPRILTRKRVILPLMAFVIAAAVIGISVTALERHAGSPRSARQAATTAPKSFSTAEAPPTRPAAFDKTRYSTSDPESPWIVVNKSHPLSPIDYGPADLTTLYGKPVSARMGGDLTALMDASAKDGVGLTLVSGYRSYAYQKNLYASYVAADGQDKADTYSARPGYSEHQTGLAVDFGDRAGTCIVEQCYAGTPEAKWLSAHAYEYGFLLRYTDEDSATTGYEAEAWHYRYVGRELAAEMRTENVATLEQFFGIGGGSTYQ